LALRGIRANRRSGETLATPIGEAEQIRSANTKFSRIFLCSLHFTFSGVRIAAPIVLAQLKDNERIGEALKTIHSASPIVIEIA
jgi:hypothetical protein